jgi:hypothetical protein
MPAVEGPGAAFAMDMTVTAQRHAVFLQKLKDFIAAISPVYGRVVKKDKLLSVPGRLERGFEPHDLPAHDFRVMLTAFFFLTISP